MWLFFYSGRGLQGMLRVCMYTFLMWLFLVWMGVIGIFRVWVKILEFVGMLFIYLKGASKKLLQMTLLYTSVLKWLAWVLNCNFLNNSKTSLLWKHQNWPDDGLLKKENFWTYEKELHWKRTALVTSTRPLFSYNVYKKGKQKWS